VPTLRARAQETERLRTLPEATVRALRDVDENALERVRKSLDATDYGRAVHVVRENQRTLDMARALREEDTDALATLMAGSHESLRDLYQVSCPELDALVTIAAAQTSCRGARMTGAGFGGCAVALVDVSGVDAFAEEVRARYGAGEIYVCRAVSGARLVD